MSSVREFVIDSLKGYYERGPVKLGKGESSSVQGEGTEASGFASHAEGNHTVASGYASHAEGYYTIASGESSHAEGDTTVASGNYSHAEGYCTSASGSYSHAEGDSTVASGVCSHAEGQFTTASGNYSHAEGERTTASGVCSHAEGDSTRASGNYSHAEGTGSTASGQTSHAEGLSTVASGDYSHAEGNQSIASGSYSHAEGYNTVASKNSSHAEGLTTVASGNGAHAEGNKTVASRQFSHAEGWSTSASGISSHAEGWSTEASGISSHAEGYNTVASGSYSHAEGTGSIASGESSHAEGNLTIASGYASHAEGTGSTASGDYSHAEGLSTMAINQYEHAEGKYNATASGQIFSIGVGTSTTARKNAISVITGSGTTPSASVYIYGVGGYDGTNPVPGTNDVASVISNFATLEKITWSDLKSRRDNSQLTPGQYYEITDYTCTTTQENTQAAGHDFDVIVLALAANKLSEEARAIQHEGDTYFAASKLEAWKLWYCLDNDTTRFAWADSENGKGVIYRMIDEWGNDCPYDFKNILFKRYDVSEFTLIDGQNYSDFSEQKKAWFNSVSGTLPYRFCNAYSTPLSGQDAVDGGYADLLGVDEQEILESGLSYCIIDDPEWLGDPGLIASFNESSISVEWFYTFTNRINNSNSDKSLTEVCYNNVFKEKASTLRDNVFISTDLNLGCYSNTFGNSCYSNTFGNSCNYNTFGNYCNSNTFGNSSVTKSYYRRIIFENENRYIRLYCSSTTSNSNYFQNVKIAQGVNNSAIYKTITDSNVGQTFQTVYQPENSQTINV